jgi:hypothetical protein
VGSSPISHPTEYAVKSKGYKLWLVAFFVLWRSAQALEGLPCSGTLLARDLPGPLLDAKGARKFRDAPDG